MQTIILVVVMIVGLVVLFGGSDMWTDPCEKAYGSGWMTSYSTGSYKECVHPETGVREVFP